MRLAHAFEPLPLLVAAIIGALVVWIAYRNSNTPRALVVGAVAGVFVQVGVRLLGVS